MHIVIDIRPLQIPNSRDQAPNHALRGWLSAFLKMPYEHRVTLLVDPRFEMPVLDVPLSGPFWQTTPFESHPEVSATPSRKAEQLASHHISHFLLQQSADLFHITSLFEFGTVVGYPPSVCRCVATVSEATYRRWPNETRFEQDDEFAATYYAKVQALHYCTRMVVNRQSVASQLVKLTNVPSYLIDVINDGLSPPEAALAFREMYQHALASPFIMTSWGVVFTPPTPRDIPTNDYIETKGPSLAAQADMADRDYRVQSNMPVVGAVIAGIRRKMTYHLREQYFDPLIEQQVSFNQKIVEGLRLVGQLLTEHEQLVKLGRAQKYLQHVHASQDIIDEAGQKAKEDQALNPYLLAGPLPEYGDFLGRDFYERLYNTSLISMPDVSESQKRINQSLLHALNHLAQQAEAYYEQRKSLGLTQLLQPQRRQMILEDVLHWLRSTNKSTDYPQISDQAHIGRRITAAAPHLTSPLRSHYIEPIVEKQERFNRLLVASLCDLYLFKPIRLKQLEDAAKITFDSSIAYSTKPIVGPLITWLQKNSISHLQYPYIVPIFKRQELFNQAVVSILATMNQQLTITSLYEHYEQIISEFEIKRGLKELKERNFAAIDENGQPIEPSMEQTDFIHQFMALIEQMNSQIEALL